jgi:hypothetical protein
MKLLAHGKAGLYHLFHLIKRHFGQRFTVVFGKDIAMLAPLIAGVSDMPLKSKIGVHRTSSCFSWNLHNRLTDWFGQACHVIWIILLPDQQHHKQKPELDQQRHKQKPEPDQQRRKQKPELDQQHRKRFPLLQNLRLFLKFHS